MFPLDDNRLDRAIPSAHLFLFRRNWTRLLGIVDASTEMVEVGNHQQQLGILQFQMQEMPDVGIWIRTFGTSVEEAMLDHFGMGKALRFDILPKQQSPQTLAAYFLQT
jgi:hypothetical protein